MIYIPAIIGFSILFSLGAAEKMSDEVSLIAAAACFAVSVFLLLFKRFRKIPVYSVVLFSAALSICYFSFYSQNVKCEIVPNRVYTVEGEISQFPNEKNEKYYYVLDNVKIDNEKINGKARISSDKKLDAKMYDKIEAKCFVYENRNSNYYASKGIYIFGSINDFESAQIINGNKKDIKYYTEYLKSNIINALNKYIPKSEAAFLCGILTGDKSGISNSLYIDFKSLGLAHWLAVSGLHLSILAGVLSFLLQKLNRYAKVSLIVAVLIFFAAITGFPSSVVRSLVMNVLVLLSALFYRKADSINSLGIAIIIICLHSPFAIYDIGFLLSVFSTLGILLLSNRIDDFLKSKVKRPENKKLRKIINAVFGTLSCSISATVFVLPFSIYCFGTVSAVGILTNLIFMLPLSLLFVLAGVISILFYVPFADLILRGISFITAIITRVMIQLAESISKFSYISISVYSAYFQIWFIITLILLLLAIAVYKRKAFIFAAVLSFVMFIAAFTVNQISLSKSVQITTIDGGNKLSVIVSDRENTLVIGTDSFYLEDSLSAMSFSKIEGAMILDASYDALSGAMLLCNEFETKKLYFKDGYINGVVENDAQKYKAKENVFESEKYTAEIFEAENGVYVVLKAEGKSFLICSDRAVLSKISGYYDYVITSSDNVDAENLKADTVIISSYEDGAEKIAKRFDDISNKYIATSGKGDIIINIKNGKESIRRGYNGRA